MIDASFSVYWGGTVNINRCAPGDHNDWVVMTKNDLVSWMKIWNKDVELSM